METVTLTINNYDINLGRENLTDRKIIQRYYGIDFEDEHYIFSTDILSKKKIFRDTFQPILLYRVVDYNQTEMGATVEVVMDNDLIKRVMWKFHKKKIGLSNLMVGPDGKLIGKLDLL